MRYRVRDAVVRENPADVEEERPGILSSQKFKTDRKSKATRLALAIAMLVARNYTKSKKIRKTNDGKANKIY